MFIHKKHHQQMTRPELKKLNAFIQGQNLINYRLSIHTIQRLEQKCRNIRVVDMLHSLKELEVVEYKEIKNSIRLVVRSTYNCQGQNIVFVLDVLDKAIITLWTNKVADKHETLDLSEYDKYLKIKL